MANKKEAAAPVQTQQDVVVELSTRVARSTVAVIDTIVQRGGFKGEELSTIGQLRDQSLQLIQIAEAIQSEAAQN